MKFTTPCFVRVEDAEKRKELNNWLSDIGYVVGRRFGNYIFVKHQTASHSFEVEYDPQEVIDCSTNISLFKALAAMNDENDKEQWFVGRMLYLPSNEIAQAGDETFVLCKEDRFLQGRYTPRDYHYNTPRKATAEEIIEHFKNQKS